MAALLCCGPEAVLSHASAASLWGIRCGQANAAIHVSTATCRRRHGIVVHRRADMEQTQREGIPLTTPIATLIDIACGVTREQLEAAVNQADRLDLTNPEKLRAALELMPRRPGTGILRALLDRRTFTLTDSALERRFLRITSRAGLPPPETQHLVNGYRVDFYWREFALVVETDGLRYHRTAAQQAKDRLRDQAHSAAGMTTVRFTHSQVMFEPDHVRAILGACARGIA